MDPIQNSRLLQLPEYDLTHVLSFVGAKERMQGVKALQAAVDSSLIVSDWPEIARAPEGSLIDRVKKDLPQEGETADRVKAVRQDAIRNLQGRRNKLCLNDYEEMGVAPRTPIAEYSYRMMNEADARIERNTNDEALIEAFDRICRAYPQVADSAKLPDAFLFEHPIRGRASRIRSWMAAPNHQAQMALVRHFNEIGLSRVPPELLLFPNLKLDNLLLRAKQANQTDLVEAILNIPENDPRSVDQSTVDHLFAGFLNCNLYLPMMAAFFRGRYPLNPDWVAHFLKSAVENRNWEFVRLILESRKPFNLNPQKLGGILRQAVVKNQLEIVGMILGCGLPIDSSDLGSALYTSSEGQDDIGKLILASPHIIYSKDLFRWVQEMAQSRNWAAVQAFLKGPRKLGETDLGKLLREAMGPSGHWETAKMILSTDQRITSEYVGLGLRLAYYAGQKELLPTLLARKIDAYSIQLVLNETIANRDLETLQLLLRSNQEIPENDRKRAVFEMEKLEKMKDE